MKTLLMFAVMTLGLTVPIYACQHEEPEADVQRTKNSLQHATSPYLLQHQYNPVDWHEWDDEALALAKKENKPIFLSVGYSACHWCHVMEHESFENEDIAKLMNEHFVCIKVDREERPDIDRHLHGRGAAIMNRPRRLADVGLDDAQTSSRSDRGNHTSLFSRPARSVGMPGFDRSDSEHRVTTMPGPTTTTSILTQARRQVTMIEAL